jgi:hypothetical protein
MFASAGSESAFIFRITCPRCAFTVHFADPELARHLFVRETRDDEQPDVTLAARERRVAVAQRFHARFVLRCTAAAFEGIPLRVQQHVVAERLDEELHGSRFHRLDAHANVAARGDKDDGHVGPIDSHSFLEIETVGVGRGHVENQTARHRGPGAGQELLRRRKCLRLPAGCLDQQFQRIAYRDVLVDDEYDGVTADAREVVERV